MKKVMLVLSLFFIQSVYFVQINGITIFSPRTDSGKIDELKKESDTDKINKIFDKISKSKEIDQDIISAGKKVYAGIASVWIRPFSKDNLITDKIKNDESKAWLDALSLLEKYIKDSPLDSVFSEKKDLNQIDYILHGNKNNGIIDIAKNLLGNKTERPFFVSDVKDKSKLNYRASQDLISKIATQQDLLFLKMAQENVQAFEGKQVYDAIFSGVKAKKDKGTQVFYGLESLNLLINIVRSIITKLNNDVEKFAPQVKK